MDFSIFKVTVNTTLSLTDEGNIRQIYINKHLYTKETMFSIIPGMARSDSSKVPKGLLVSVK